MLFIIKANLLKIHCRDRIKTKDVRYLRQKSYLFTAAFMANRLLIALLIFVVFPFSGIAQSQTEASFSSIPDSLFEESQYSANPEVPFIYSLKKLDVSFQETEQSLVAVLKYHVRVKIFDSSVQEASVVGIPYYFENNIEQVQDIRGVTWQSPSKKVSLSPQQVRTININSRYNVKEFTMPAVTDGSVIEYTYTVRRRYIEELPDFYLAHQVPTKQAQVSITYPRYLRYKGVVQDYSGQISHFTSRFVPEGDVPKIYVFPQPDPVVTETWRATDIPPIQEEAYITSLDDYRGKIKFQLSEFGIPRQTLENSWEFVVAEIRRKQQINERIDSYEQAYQIGKEIGAQLGEKQVAQDSIFRYLNATVNYSGIKAPFSSADDQSVLNGEPSDQAAINQTLVAMLRGAGIEANPVLISTRSSGQLNRDFPSFFQFNGQLVHSSSDGQTFFMDASFPYSHPNLIPVEMYNENGLMLGSSDYKWVDVAPAQSVFAIDVDIKARLDRQGNLSGSLRATNAGYPAQQVRQRLAEGVPLPQVIKDAVLDGYSDLSISEAQLENSSQQDSIVLSANFNIQDYAVSFTSGLDFRPMIVGYLLDNPFEDAQRDLPITLDAPEQLNLSYTIQLPEGMSLAEPPRDSIINLPGAIFRETYNIDGNTLRYEYQINISQKKFSADLYSQLYNLYSRWVEISNSRWRITR